MVCLSHPLPNSQWQVPDALVGAARCMAHKAKLENLPIEARAIRVVTAKVRAEAIGHIWRRHSYCGVGEHHVDCVAVRGEDSVDEVEVDNCRKEKVYKGIAIDAEDKPTMNSTAMLMLICTTMTSGTKRGSLTLSSGSSPMLILLCHITYVC